MNAINELDLTRPDVLFYLNVYKILIENAGAYNDPENNFEYFSFVRAHTDGDICNEYRFGGKLGFAGKYWSRRNEVDCYSEYSCKRTEKIKSVTNEKLHELYDTFVTIKNLDTKLQKVELEKIAKNMKL